MKESNYFPEFDMLRGVAILLVLLFHLQIPWFENGYLGVDVFFVLSGFLIIRSLEYKNQYFNRPFILFFKKRFIKLFPVYALVTLTVYILTYFQGITERVVEKYLSIFLFFYNYFLLLEHDFFLVNMDLFPLAHLWSLSVEAQFYLLSPILFFLIVRTKEQYRFILLFTLLLSLYFLYVNKNMMNPVMAYFDFRYRAWQFILGGIILSISAPKNASKVSPLFILFGSLLLLVACFAPITIYERLLRTSLASFSTLILILGVFWRGSHFLPYNLFLSSLLVKIGKMSYSIYVWHYSVIILLRPFLYGKLGDTYLVNIALVIGISLISWLSYWGVEEKFKSIKKKDFYG